MRKYAHFYLLMPFLILGCVSARVSGTGINVHDPIHGVEVQANSFNSEIEINAAK